MYPFLTEENLQWKERAHEVAEKVVRPLAQKYDELQEYPWEIKDALAEAGLLGVWIPKKYGGSGAGVLNLCLCVEELSRACGGVGVAYAVNALGSFPILLSGTEEQKAKYLPQIASGAGAFVIEVNIGKSAVTHCSDLFIEGRSGEVLPVIAAETERILGLTR